MGNNEKLNEVQEIVKKLVLDRFPDATIIDVKILRDCDYEDDEVLRVQVIFKSPHNKLDTAATSGFLRHLRPKLSDIGVGAFPVMSFISESDAGVAA